MNKKLDGLSLDLESTNKDKLKSVFPECFSEGMLDIDKLLSLCGEYIDNDFEKYKFEWKGKAECLRLAQKRSTGTLRPCREESMNFDETENLYIEGDNLEVLKLLQTAYYRKVKMIYIDPPYNTGNDFVYEDNFADPMARYKEVTQQTTKSNPETMGRFHTNWLNMMYPRLRLAANLLRDDGSIFVSIDDNEVHNLRKLCDEVFGEENFLAQITVVNNLKGRNDRKNVATCHEYLLIYGKSDFQANGLPLTQEQKAAFDKVDEYGNKYQLRDLRKRGQGDRKEDRPNMYFPIYFDKESGQCSLDFHEKWIEIYPLRGDGSDGRWRWGRERVGNNLSILEAKQVRNSEKWGVEYRVFLNPILNNSENVDDQADMEEERDSKSKSFWNSPEISTDVARRQMKLLFENAVFEFPKSVDLIKKALYMGTSKEDIILDFFSGSATTAHAVMQLNAEDGGKRKFICVQLPEVTDEKSEAYKAGYKNICEIGKERIRRAGKSITYRTEEQKKVLEDTLNQVKLEFGEDSVKPIKLDIGFKVFKLDTSNLREWDSTPVPDNDINLFYQRLNDMVDSIKPNRTAMDVVYEVMLKMGIPLDVPVTYMEVTGKVCYVVGDLLLLICFAENLTAEDIEAMAEYAPAKMILAEQSFDDDTALSNAHYILRDKQIELKLV
jgi:adenine-specific DNA-methyltransferase